MLTGEGGSKKGGIFFNQLKASSDFTVLSLFHHFGARTECEMSNLEAIGVTGQPIVQKSRRDVVGPECRAVLGHKKDWFPLVHCGSAAAVLKQLQQGGHCGEGGGVISQHRSIQMELP